MELLSSGGGDKIASASSNMTASMLFSFLLIIIQDLFCWVSPLIKIFSGQNRVS